MFQEISSAGPGDAITVLEISYQEIFVNQWSALRRNVSLDAAESEYIFS